MKKVLNTTLILLISTITAVQARILPDSVYTREETILERIYFPTEIGYSIVPSREINNGVFWRTSLEYRIHSRGGWFFTIEYNDHEHTYKNRHFNGSNCSEGEENQFDILAGSGFRIPLTPHWRVAALIQGGVTRNHLKNIYTDSDNFYRIEDSSTWVPSGKGTLFVEYYIVPDVALFLDAGYTHHHKALPSELKRRSGLCSISVGVTWCLY